MKKRTWRVEFEDLFSLILQLIELLLSSRKLGCPDYSALLKKDYTDVDKFHTQITESNMNSVPTWFLSSTICGSFSKFSPVILAFDCFRLSVKIEFSLLDKVTRFY